MFRYLRSWSCSTGTRQEDPSTSVSIPPSKKRRGIFNDGRSFANTRLGGRGGGGWKRIQLNSHIYAGINYSGGRKDPGRYHAAATTILTAPPLPPLSTTTATIDLLLSLVFFQPDFSVSLRTGMQFTELFLNPSGGTTAEQEESAPERKKK